MKETPFTFVLVSNVFGPVGHLSFMQTTLTNECLYSSDGTHVNKIGHGNKFERISSNFIFEYTKFEFSKNRNKFESLCSNFEQTAVSIKRTSDISPIYLVPRGPVGPLMFPSC